MRQVIVTEITVRTSVVVLHGMDDRSDEELLDMVMDDPPIFDEKTPTSTRNHYGVVNPDDTKEY